MKINNLIFILLSISFTLPLTQQFITDIFSKNNPKRPIHFDEVIFNSLSFLQRKLLNDTFTDKDMFVLISLLEFIHKRRENINQSKTKEQTVYWLLRQGR